MVDLVNPSNRWFYLSEAHFPRGGITNDFYRQQSIVMRRIPAAGVKWTMGLSSEDFSNVSSDMTFNAPQHYVKLTDDYYIGVFELTMGQVRKFTNAEMVKGYINKFYHTDSTGNANAYQYYHKFHNGDTNNCPAGEMTMKFLRTTSSSSALNWPACRHWVDPKSWLGKVRAKTGVDFDLPTEAQWEFACRAGTGTMTYAGNYLSGGAGHASREAYLKPVAWYDETAGGCLHRVGTRRSNGFGIYDMIGNIDELCLDRYSIDCGIGDADVTASVFEDPEGPASGDERVYRGSYCLYSYVAMYSAARHPKQQWYGARLMCPVGLLFPAAEKSAPAQ